MKNIKNFILTLFALAVFTGVSLQASAQKIQGDVCTMSVGGNLNDGPAGLVRGSFECGTIGKNLSIQEIYQKGWRVVSFTMMPYICSEDGAAYTCGSLYNIIIEKQ